MDGQPLFQGKEKIIIGLGENRIGSLALGSIGSGRQSGKSNVVPRTDFALAQAQAARTANGLSAGREEGFFRLKQEIGWVKGTGSIAARDVGWNTLRLHLSNSFRSMPGVFALHQTVRTRD